MKLACPSCGASSRSGVIETRQKAGGVVHRRRECRCGARWTSVEINAEIVRTIGKMQKYTATLAKHSDQLAEFARKLGL